MQNNTTSHAPKAQHRATPVPARAAPASSPDWRPQPCGLTRQELREIVARIMG